MVTPTAMIELHSLHRFYGTTHAVNDVSFTVNRGQVFGYIGPNGAGKSTSMRILATLDLPDDGDAFVDGLSVVDDPDRVRRKIGYMPDSYGTYANMNCEDYLDFFARSYGLTGCERREAVQSTLAFTGVDVLAEKPINGLSKGMKQRLCLGRALVHDPDVLILDEPAAGLDPRARIELRVMFRELAKRGKTILVSSHILTELAEMCDAVGIIERGQLLAVGTVDELQKGGKEQSVIQIRVLGNMEALSDWFTHRAEFSEIEVDGDLLHVSHDEDRNQEADLLKELVEHGFRIVEFGSRKKSLEDVFLHVTKGVVQ